VICELYISPQRTQTLQNRKHINTIYTKYREVVAMYVCRTMLLQCVKSLQLCFCYNGDGVGQMSHDLQGPRHCQTFTCKVQAYTAWLTFRREAFICAECWACFTPFVWTQDGRQDWTQGHDGCWMTTQCRLTRCSGSSELAPIHPATTNYTSVTITRSTQLILIKSNPIIPSKQSKSNHINQSAQPNSSQINSNTIESNPVSSIQLIQIKLNPISST